MEPYFQTERGKLYCGCHLSVLPEIPDCSIDLTVTSPPYDNLRTYNGYEFNFEALAIELFRVTKKGGVVVWVVQDATINGSETGTSFRQALYFKEIGFNLHDTMIFKKINAMPLNHNRYDPCFEYMFIFSKGFPNVFNPIMENCIYYGNIKNRELEKKSNLEKNSLSRQREEKNIIRAFKYKKNIWEYVVGIEPENEIDNHPAPFPEKLAEDHIISWSNPDDTILDPMAGSGTTLKMAERFKRNWVGIEISEQYCQITKKRIIRETRQLALI